MPTRCGEERRITQLGELTRERQAPVDPFLQERPMDRRISLLAPDHEFVEMGSGKERRLESSDFVDRCREFLRPTHVLRGDSTKAIRTEYDHVCRRRAREEGLVRANVRHGLVPTVRSVPSTEP